MTPKTTQLTIIFVAMGIALFWIAWSMVKEADRIDKLKKKKKKRPHLR